MAGLLPTIREPRDLKRLSLSELHELSREIRRVIIDTVSRTGGHLGASLGAVELTLALHTVFDSPGDKIVWDVGHQTYAHKLLTGRQERFGTIRQLHGLSGFPKRNESPHDLFETGHASTALSASLGFAKARDLQGRSHHVVAVVGDGALTGGLALEGLNNAAHARTRLIIVLNDNSMSIAPNVGAISSYLAKVRSDALYARFKDDFQLLLNRVPLLGPQVVRAAERIKDGLKHLVVPGMLFEDLGITYLGPVDGHNLGALQKVLRDARRIQGPVLVHAVTQKGKGYAPAERHPEKLHGTGPFDVVTGKGPKSKTVPPAYTRIFAEELARAAERDPRLVAITAAMPEGTGVQALAERFPHRVFDVGIAEQHAVTFAAGLAAAGMRPVCAIYSTFLQRAYDAIVHDVCRQGLPVVFAIDRAGIVGADGDTHHGVFDFAYLRHVPNMILMAPGDEEELRRMIRTAVAYEGGPIAFRYPRGNGVGVQLSEDPEPVEIGRGELLCAGRDLALFAIGSMVHPCLRAAEILRGRGVDVAVVNARFVKPLDAELLLDVASSSRCVMTVEEHVRAGGFGSAVLELFAERGRYEVPVRVHGLPDRYVEHGDPAALLALQGLDATGIAETAWQFVHEVAGRFRTILPQVAGGTE